MVVSLFTVAKNRVWWYKAIGSLKIQGDVAMRKGLLAATLLAFFAVFSAPSANAQWSFNNTSERNYSGFFQHKNPADKKTCEVWILSDGLGLEIRAVEEEPDIELFRELKVRRVMEVIVVGKRRKVGEQTWLYLSTDPVTGNVVGHSFFIGPKTYETYCQKLTANLPSAVRKQLPKKMK